MSAWSDSEDDMFRTPFYNHGECPLICCGAASSSDIIEELLLIYHDVGCPNQNQILNVYPSPAQYLD